MFTGIIEQTGTVVRLSENKGARRLTIHAPGLAHRLREGDSLGVSGVCLTALDVHPEEFHADLAAETIAKTSLALLQPGSKVNLELPTAAGSPLGGHVVQGHVDGTGTLLSLDPVDPTIDPRLPPTIDPRSMPLRAWDPDAPQDPNQPQTDWTLRVAVPRPLRRYMVPKGSIAIEGISLTIADFDGEAISIAILPLTYYRTNLHALAPGTPLNLEADVLIKYAALQLDQQAKEAAEEAAQTHPSEPAFDLTESFLLEHGY